jgi:SAM-dependent methyltransferase
VKICSTCLSAFDGEAWLCPRCGWTPPSEDGVPILAPDLAHGDGTDAEYLYDALAQAERRHFWFVSRRRLVLWAVGRFGGRVTRMLEVGCGTGFMLEGLAAALPGAALWATDARVEGLAHARARVPNATFLQMDARRPPFAGHFDVIGAFDVLEHIAEDHLALEGMARALRPGGHVVLTVPQHPWLWSAADEFACHKRRYSRPELLSRLRSCGLGVVRVTSVFAFLLPVLLASRARHRHLHQRFDPVGELRIGPRLNAVLGLLCRAEASLISRGLSLPAGASLLAVAKRLDPIPVV